MSHEVKYIDIEHNTINHDLSKRQKLNLDCFVEQMFSKWCNEYGVKFINKLPDQISKKCGNLRSS
jgi:hypothetical protein